MSSSQSGALDGQGSAEGTRPVKFSLVFKDIHPLLQTRGVGMDGTHPHTHTYTRVRKKTGFIFWECLLIALFIHSLCPRQSFGGAVHSDLPDYDWINSPRRKIIMEVWKWYTSNEVKQHGFSVSAAKSHSGPTRWQRLESKANTALVLIKRLLLPLTGFNEELEIKDKQTNSWYLQVVRVLNWFPPRRSSKA